MSLPVGLTQLANHSFAYRPKSAGVGPLPLIVLIRGALGNAEEFATAFEPIAEQRGALLLAPEAAGDSWHLTANGRKADFGADPARIDAALADLFAKAPVDPNRVILVGFSDGAGYGLSLALANPQLFKGAIALSPAYAWLSPGYDTHQRIFIAHGRRDEVLSPANVSDRILPGLKAAGFDPHMRWFAGGHRIDPKALKEGLDYVLGP